MFARKYFILAPSFHGATLLAKLLDTHPEVVCLGDTYPANTFDQVCGCRVRLSKCAFWQGVKKDLGAARYLDLPFLLPAHPGILGEPFDRLLFDNLPVAALERLVPANRLNAFVSDYRRFLSAVYGRLGRTNLTVFVDGFKLSSRLKALICANEQVDGIIHLVRDPDDFVKSSMNVSGGGVRRLARAAFAWRRRHRKIEELRSIVPYHRIEYESLCGDVDGTLARLFRFLGLPQMAAEELRRAPEHPWHYVGNASMFDFDWSIKARKHAVSKTEKFLIGKIAGTT